MCWQCISDLYFVCVESRIRGKLVNLSVSAVASPGSEPIENLANKSAIKSANKSTDKLLSNRSIGENVSTGVSPSPAIRGKSKLKF